MISTSEVLKFQELRRKTDRQLLDLVGKTLEHGLILAKGAHAHFNLGERQFAENYLGKAEQAWMESSKLLRLVRDLNGREKTLLEQMQRELKGNLDQLRELRCGVKRMACGG